MPLIFTVFGYLIVYLALKPVIELTVSVTTMIMANEVPNFNTDLGNIFEDPTKGNVILDNYIDIETGEKVSVKVNTDGTVDVQGNGETGGGSSKNQDPSKYKIESDSLKWPKNGEKYGKITCDRIGLEAPLFMGDGFMILRQGVGQYQGSFIPGYGKPIMLAGHCMTFFAPLEDVEKGDIITITTSYGVYKYKVTGSKITGPSGSGAYNLKQDREQLIMYTCYPFTLLSGSRRQRLFVYADLISGAKLK